MPFESVLGTSIRARQSYTSDQVFSYQPPGPSVVFVSDFNAFWFHLGGPNNVWQPLVPTAPQMVSVLLNQTTMGLVLGGSPATGQLIASSFDANGNPLGGRTYTWASSNVGVATVSGTGLVTAAGAGTCNVTATDTGVTANCAVTVTSTTSNEPGGMTLAIDTGAIALTSAQLQATSFATAGPTQTVFSNFSPATPSSTGEVRSNLVQPDATTGGGTGWQCNYPAGLTAANSPVRWGASIPGGAAAGVVGKLYFRYITQFTTNWISNVSMGCKISEPRSTASGSGNAPTPHTTNHINAHSFFSTNNNRQLATACLLQGPDGRFRNIAPATTTAGIVTGGQPHKVEAVWTTETPPGALNGSVQYWVDGVLVINVSGFNWLDNVIAPGFPFWMFDPVYGGGGSSPGVLMSWRMDQLRVSFQ